MEYLSIFFILVEIDGKAKIFSSAILIQIHQSWVTIISRLN